MRFSGGILASPLADLRRAERARVRDAAVELEVREEEWEEAVAFSLPHARRRDRAERALSRVWVVDIAEEGRAPMGVRVEQAWSSGKRCLRQYWRLQVWQPTATEAWLLM